jgi:hypothetical protein
MKVRKNNMEKKEMLNALEETIDSLNTYYDLVLDESAKIIVNDAIDTMRSVQWAINIKIEDK